MNKLGKYLLILLYLIRLIKEGLWNPYKKIKLDTKLVRILANGPSLKEFLSNYDNYKDDRCEYFVMNDFVNDKLFKVMRPRFYVLSDPMFFFETKRKERGIGVIKSLRDNVNWHMYLFVSIVYKKSEYLKLLQDNRNIAIVYYHEAGFPQYDGIEKERNYFYSKGFGNGEYGTVVLHAIYVAITLHAEKVELYRVDHSYFTGLCVNEDNIPCYEYKNSFVEDVELKPIEYHYNNKRAYYDMALYVLSIGKIFRGHLYMASYADYMGTSILNCTKGSLIDAYPRNKA